MPTTITLRHISKLFPVDQQDQETSVPGDSRGRQLLDALRGDHDLEPKPATPPKYPGYLAALDDVTLTVHAGETLGILGPSGCGKTTLLRIAAGLERPTEGEVLYDGENLEDIPNKLRGIGMVFQNYALYPHLPNYDNIGFFLKLRQREVEIPERVHEISELMQIDLGPLLNRKPPTLSGGEQQRIAIARCLARDPRVFLFDEPFSNLDAKLRTSARLELHRLLHRYHVTSIYVTHDQTEAIALAHRIAILNEGRLEQIGTFRHLYDRPVNAFVASFLGKPPMNLFDGYSHTGTWVGSTFSWGPIRSDLDDGIRLNLGVRPEHLIPDAEGSITGAVAFIEQIYSERVQLVYLTIGQNRAVLRLPLEETVSRGDRLRLTIMPGQVHLFDQETGERLG